MRYLEAGLIITAIGLVIALSFTIVNGVSSLTEYREPVRESMIGWGDTNYVEVQCDAFDVHVFPHDIPSRADAEEFAEQFSMSEVCHESR